MNGKRNVLVPAVVAALLALTAIARQIWFEVDFFRVAACRDARDQCDDACEREHRTNSTAVQLDRSQEDIRDARARTDCLLGLGSTEERRLCFDEADRRHGQELARLDERQRAIDEERTACEQSCRDEQAQCVRAEDEPTFTVGVDTTFEPDCEGANETSCRVEVPTLCQQIQGSCRDCPGEMCGDATWSFVSKGLVDVRLQAMTGETGDGRVLSTAGSKAGQVTLPIPADLSVSAGERLVLSFRFDGAQVGVREVSLRRAE